MAQRTSRPVGSTATIINSTDGWHRYTLGTVVKLTTQALSDLGSYAVEDESGLLQYVKEQHLRWHATERKPHVHAEAIKAWADGEFIEYCTGPDYVWRDMGTNTTAENPGWFNDYEYRVKPEAPALTPAEKLGIVLGTQVWAVTERGVSLMELIRDDGSDMPKFRAVGDFRATLWLALPGRHHVSQHCAFFITDHASAIKYFEQLVGAARTQSN